MQVFGSHVMQPFSKELQAVPHVALARFEKAEASMKLKQRLAIVSSHDEFLQRYEFVTLV